MANDYPETPGYKDTKALQYLRLRIATVTRVDWSRMTVDVKFLTGTGGRRDVPMNATYWSAGAFMGAVPEEGSLCVVGFHHRGADTWDALILTYLPLAPIAARRIESQQQGLPPEGDDDFRNEFSSVIRSRLRKLYPGQILLQSRQGADVVLTDDVLLSNAAGNELVLRTDDQMLVTNAVGQVFNTSGGFIKLAPVYRNGLVLDDHVLRAGSAEYGIEQGTTLIDPTDFEGALNARLIRPVVLANGKKMNYIGDLPLTADQGVFPFTEYRTEISEYTPLQMNITEDTDLITEPSEGFGRPLVEQVMGTVIGRDQGNKETYGRVLKPTLYATPTDSTGTWAWQEAPHAFGIFRENEVKAQAAAYYLRVGNYQKAITKAGNVFISIPRSTGGSSLGDGHSLHADLKGAAKVTLGKERQTGASLLLNAEGSIKATVGGGQVDEAGNKGRSIEITTASGINIEAKGSDEDNHSWRETLLNKKRVEVGGDYNLEVKGNYNLLVHGVINEQILSKKVENYVADKNTNYGGSHKETIIDSKQTMIGQGRIETIASPGTNPAADALTILVGNKLVTVALGNVIETVAAGNSLETIAAGNKAITIGAGTFNVTVGTGAITVTTGVGAISITTAAGAMTLTATGVVQITGGIINVTGGSVNIGSAPAGGVVTSIHPCLVTGAPHIGSVTVRAGP